MRFHAVIWEPQRKNCGDLNGGCKLARIEQWTRGEDSSNLTDVFSRSNALHSFDNLTFLMNEQSISDNTPLDLPAETPEIQVTKEQADAYADKVLARIKEHRRLAVRHKTQGAFGSARPRKPLHCSR